MEKGFEVRKPPENASPAVWTPFSSTPKIDSSNPFFGGVNGTSNSPHSPVSSGTSSTPGTSGPYWSIQSPRTQEVGGPQWGQQYSNSPSITPTTPKGGVPIFPVSTGQMPSPVAKSLTKAPSSVPPPPPPPPPPPGTDGMPTWREKQKVKSQDKDAEPRNKILKYLLSCVCECFLCSEEPYWPNSTRELSEETHELHLKKMANRDQRNVNNLEDDADQQYSNLPSKLYGTLKKDKKPFTYTPGGIDLSEIRSPRMAKRIIANQQDPGVAAKPKPPGAQVQAEVHAPENRVPLQTTPTRQPVLPVMINQQPVLPPLSNPTYSVDPKLTPQKQKVDAYPTAYVDESYNTQRGNISRQLQGLNLANNERDPYYFEPPEQYPKTLPPSHGIRHDLDSQEPRNFGQSRSFRILQKITSTDESDAPKESYDNPEQLDETIIEPRYKGGNIPSYAFKILQEMTGSDEEENWICAGNWNNGCGRSTLLTTPRSGILKVSKSMLPMAKGFSMRNQMSQKSLNRKPGVNVEKKNKKPFSLSCFTAPQSPSAAHPNRKASKTQMHVLDPHQPLPPKQFPHPEVPASQLPSEPEPKKYTGGHIPSRSFRMLQTMTGEDQDATGNKHVMMLPI
ncbi:uncharacterized protein LOC143257701 [Tachypleus tridentatus]|uniref:uncharacterized protein LOC143257701 n=1 Tax=Tachypleus tridentatus TaxID=6853 RepID=UPI003FD21EEC